MKPSLRFSLVLLASMLGFWGCRSSQRVATQHPQNHISATADTSQIDYTLIYVIHGDGNYLYHNQEGESRLADVQKLKEAMRIGRRAKRGEVFIFHQRPEKKILWIFPKKDRKFLHYRNGKLVQEQKYSPASDSESFVTEGRLFQKYKSDQSSRQFFLYFGHEIPHKSGTRYHSSRPHSQFDTQIFARGLHSFLNNGERFDLTVLSTCENGTPLMVSALHPMTQYLLASPQNLHLSHIDSEALLQLESDQNIPTLELADSLALFTYDRLAAFIQTSITLSVYKTDIVISNLGEVTKRYNNLQDKAEKENVDCATLKFWDLKSASNGVKVLYKPPQFGRRVNQKSYSGWGCQPDLFE